MLPIYNKTPNSCYVFCFIPYYSEDSIFIFLYSLGIQFTSRICDQRHVAIQMFAIITNTATSQCDI